MTLASTAGCSETILRRATAAVCGTAAHRDSLNERVLQPGVLAAGLPAGLRASPSPVAALRAALIEFNAGVDSREAFANHLAFLNLDLTDPELRAQAAKQSRQLRRCIAQLIEEAIDAGEMLAADPAELADTIYTVYNGALLGWAIDGKGCLSRWISIRFDRVLASHLRSTSARPPRP